MNSHLNRIPLRRLIATLVLATGLAHADVTPASLFCDHAVLQQGVPIPVWGTADDGEKITVTLAGQTATSVARDGKWSVRLGALSAGGPHVLTIAGRNRIELSDVLIGEVWVCSGQSNMERQLGLRDGQQPIKNWEAEAAAADFPQIRHFGVEQRLALEPQTQAGGRWVVCSPKTVADFTAVGFFFGRALHLARGVPVGLIHSSWGGTPAEAWTSREGIARIPEAQEAVAQLDHFRRDPAGARTAYQQSLARWFETNDPGSRPSSSLSGPAVDTSIWRVMRLPNKWEDAGLPGFDGVAWFRREFDLPANWAGREASLHLGAIDDADSTWVNGRLIGNTSSWNTPRVYSIPAGTLKPGRNVIAVRVLDTGGGGGLWGGTDAIRLVSADQSAQTVTLAGDWRYHPSIDGHTVPPPPVDVTAGSGAPTVLYNGMIAPLQPYAIRGVIWYQGEANAGQAQAYRRIFPNLVADWRRAWGQGDFPFLYVQIAPYREMPPEIREAQRLSLAKIPQSAMAVTLDVGDAEDIHPTDKKPVGERLALAARAVAYDEKIEYSGPLFAGARIEGGHAVLTFTHLGGGLVARGGALQGFAIAGADQVFHTAYATIVGDTVEVSADDVSAPVAVRYAWANVPEGNLFNQAGLPASPFATDSE